ncbi:hypothetical protein KRR38_30790 [Novosphingobium sp. G106]|uniref:hypothetical protein n=1 Tax=Novosphingobium sp. G106 TaxID=2849500 RepID=UPI001C2D0F57|nr:hypothetical protein [Novosphingobium sp. G106]MBV1691936.1 hypothetical protein [Novosphingobium sp. G106]
MTWKTIRLELARTEDHPEGSSRHIYILHLPLSEDGMIDETELGHQRGQATVRKHWGEDHPRNGYVVRTPAGWALSYERGPDDDETLFHLENHSLKVGEYITVADTDGVLWPLRVVTSLALADAPSGSFGGTKGS